MPYTFKRLLSSETIGDSLSAVNNNYYNLDVWTNAMITSATTMWEPLIDYYNYYKSDWNQIITLTRANSAKWLSMVTTVEANSARWIEPISIYYPGFFPEPFTSEEVVTVTNFLKEAFPLYPGKGDYPGVYGQRLNLPSNAIVTADFIDTDEDNKDDRYQRFPGDDGTKVFTAAPVYVENQTAIVYSLAYTQSLSAIAINSFLTDFTICATNPRRVCVTCYNYYSGGGPCGWGNVNCASYSNSCSQCKDVECFYNNPPYEPIAAGAGNYVPLGPTVGAGGAPVDVNSSWKFGRSKIEANVSMNYSERREAINIIAIVYRVKNCQWTFEKFITA
jgi:hypothetical protein